MRVLVACEFSGRVRDAFRVLGHDAWSCDFLACESPGPHFQCDVRDVLEREYFDLLICHPECTYLCSSGLHWNKRVLGRAEKTKEALDFVRFLLSRKIKRIALENPVGCIGTEIKPASQYIHPYEFGEDASKRTGLWLKNLPRLRSTLYVPPRWVCPCKRVYPSWQSPPVSCLSCGRSHKQMRPRWSNQTNSGQNKETPSEHRHNDRSRTYLGIARALAWQWGGLS